MRVCVYVAIDQLFSFFARLHFVVYASLLSCVMLGMLIALKWLEHVESRDAAKYESLRKLHRFMYPAVSGASVIVKNCLWQPVLLFHLTRHRWSTERIVCQVYSRIAGQYLARQWQSLYALGDLSGHWSYGSVRVPANQMA